MLVEINAHSPLDAIVRVKWVGRSVCNSAGVLRAIALVLEAASSVDMCGPRGGGSIFPLVQYLGNGHEGRHANGGTVAGQRGGACQS